MFDQIKITPRYNELYGLFEKIFRAKNLHRDDTFSTEVFFLSEDIELLTIDSSKTPDNENRNQMHKMLRSLNTEKNSSQLKVKVHNFISDLSCELIRLEDQKEKITEKIMSFNIDETLNVIEQKLYNLSTNKNLFGSNLKNQPVFLVGLSRLDNFPPGNYSFKLKMRKIKKNSLIDSGIIDTEDLVYSLLSTIKKDSMSLLDLKDRSNDYIFPQQTLLPVELNYNEFKADDPIIKQYSGTNIAFFEIEIKDEVGNVYNTSPQEILDLYIKLSNFFTDFTQIRKEFDLKLVTQKVLASNNQDISCSIIVNIFMEINTSVRKNVLERIYYIFKNTIAYRMVIDKTQRQFIKYFSNFDEKIREILETIKNNERSECCYDSCKCF